MMKTFKNSGLLFNKYYFDGINFKSYPERNEREKEIVKRVNQRNEGILEDRNKILFDTRLNNSDSQSIGNKSFMLKTTYPGLLLGSGYAHEGNILGELKLGFYFDYSSGIPIIPASSVKGVLRSAFDKARKTFGDHKLSASCYVKEILNTISENKNWSLAKVYQLEQIIFEGNENENIYQRDIFLDAFPIGDVEKGKFIGDDYITPHNENPLKNPTPVRFLKILPNVTVRFDFILTDNGMSADMKIKLFSQIIQDLGIGAKSNVGYGQLIVDPQQEEEERKRVEKRKREEIEEDQIAKAEEEEKERQKILANIKIAAKKEEEERKGRKENEKNDMKINGLKNILPNLNDINIARKKIEIFTKMNLSLQSQTEYIKVFVKNAILRDKTDSKRRRKWRKKGKDNWRLIAKWTSIEISDEWFEEYKDLINGK